MRLTIQDYRRRGAATLILLTALVGGMAFPVLAANEDDWPEPVYFPQRSETPPGTPDTPTANAPGKNSGAETSTAGSPDSKKTDKDDTSKKKRGIWPFRRGQKAPTSPYPPKITRESGKQDPPSSPYPLLRLSIPLLAEDNRIIPSGIYLLKPEPGNGGGLPPGERYVVLTRENKVMLRLAVHLSRKPDSNLAVTGTPSPITPTDPQTAAKTLKAGLQIAPDLKSITITVQEGDQRFESNPLPVATERRPVLKF